ncbi:MAG: exopolyphosphatase / guanosine-5-triphosphate,3-diphosphate pyrophosphatase [Actinomycetota bacterium]|jgi:exopolyphosphatase/guanosine-5'-triphosphate,3'-diphosphate pyrophosphatase|nr:exopolyphosphatase / guanosine-5-triphosphate,3-diphosphate pyrophosphatase [Actinomycetota bacterium]
MTRVAAIDCGTNSIRLLVTDIADGRQNDLHREMRVVRLGQGVDRTGRLAPEAIERTRSALVDYAATCRELAAEKVRMVATSASRDADNGEDFRAVVVDVLGAEPEVISGDEEAALSFGGATRTLDPHDGPFLVMDIGGGSTELVLGTAHVTAARSVDVGCVRLTERHLIDDPPTEQQVAAAERDIDAAIDQARAVVPLEDARTAVGLAGSVTTVAALSLGLSSYDRDRIHLSRLTAADIEKVTSDVLAMTRADRAALPVMHPGRIDVIGAGALILRTLVRRLDLGEVLVSEADILDGIAWSIA